MEEMRLQKFLAQAGVASRRKAEELIMQGKVKVNGAIVSELGTKVGKSDRVEMDGQLLGLKNKKIYVMLHKPVGYITTVRDEFGRPTVLQLVKEISERLYPVGRLDYDTSGLLILTNDGDFTFGITHPKNEKEKTYVAQVKGIPTSDALKRFEKGLIIEDYVTAPAKIRVLETMPGKSLLEISIHEGRKRQVRKMCEAIGNPVLTLKRVAIGALKLGDLPVGKWRYITSEEVKKFK